MSTLVDDKEIDAIATCVALDPIRAGKMLLDLISLLEIAEAKPYAVALVLAKVHNEGIERGINQVSNLALSFLKGPRT